MHVSGEFQGSSSYCLHRGIVNVGEIEHLHFLVLVVNVDNWRRSSWIR